MFEDVTERHELTLRLGHLDGELTLNDRFGRPQQPRLTATPLLRASGEVHGAVVTLADTPTDRELQDVDHSR